MRGQGFRIVGNASDVRCPASADAAAGHKAPLQGPPMWARLDKGAEASCVSRGDRSWPRLLRGGAMGWLMGVPIGTRGPTRAVDRQPSQLESQGDPFRRARSSSISSMSRLMV